MNSDSARIKKKVIIVVLDVSYEIDFINDPHNRLFLIIEKKLVKTRI